MTIPPLTSLPSPLAGQAQATPGDDPTTFQTLLEQQTQPTDDARKQAEKAAAGLVSQALILPVLKQLRRSSLDSKGPFSPGIAEKTFGPEFDMQLADRIAHSPQLGVTKALTERLMKRNAAPETGKVLNAHG